MIGVSEVFPTAKHKECMYHLVQYFKKRYSGKVFDDHLWALYTHGAHTCLRSTIKQWLQPSQMQ
jgi:hypothetical protein